MHTCLYCAKGFALQWFLYFLYSPLPSTSRREYRFVDDVPRRFVCTICLCILKKPNLTGCCGIHCCECCLKQWLVGIKPKKTCPHCRAERVNRMWNKSLEREIDELSVYCPNRERRCNWVGEKGSLKSHLMSDSGCQYEDVNCGNSLCTTIMERRYVSEHMENTCVHRPYTCQYCGHRDTYQAITEGYHGFSSSHYDECEKYPLNCPNECGTTDIMRKKMLLHLKKCPLQTVSCPYVDTGCEKRAIKRRDLETHLAEGIHQHMSGMHRCYTSKIKKLSQKNHQLQQENDSLLARVEALEDETEYNSYH